MKKTIVQIAEDVIVVADEVVGIEEKDHGIAWILLRGGHKIRMPMEEDMNVAHVAAQIFSFTAVDDESEATGEPDDAD